MKRIKKRIYISGKITGTSDYIERFARAEEKLKDKGGIVINPAKLNMILPENTTWEEYMKISIAMLEMADCIYMLKGWEDSKGAKEEYAKACRKGIEIIHERE